VPLANTIVSYQNIVSPFSGPNGLLDAASKAARKAIPDQTRADARVAQLAAGLEAMRVRQGKYPRVMHTPCHDTGALLQTHLVNEAGSGNKLERILLKGIEFVLEIFDVRFSQADFLEYAFSFFTWIEGIIPATRPPASDTPETIPDNCAVALIGDFGTGLYGSRPCAESIADDKEGYDLLLHLGDVYYSGLGLEIQSRFLDILKDVKVAKRRTLNGNHEMYTGGHGYFGTLLPAFGQTTSYFAMQNSNWLLVGLDTAYKQAFGGREGVIDSPQVEWLGPMLRQAGDRKVVLFTHHEPFTLLDNNNGGNLISALSEFLETGKIVAWYWGHEHRCVRHDPHPKYKFQGRCVGHGGFPQERADLGNAPGSTDFGSQWRYLPGPAKTDIPGGWVLDTGNVYVAGFEEAFGPHGFMRLEFRGDQLIEYVRAPDNANIYLKNLA
jgi:3',5'-cyclic AMP phosphodiesterase CpdA